MSEGCVSVGEVVAILSIGVGASVGSSVPPRGVGGKEAVPRGVGEGVTAAVGAADPVSGSLARHVSSVEN